MKPDRKKKGSGAASAGNPPARSARPTMGVSEEFEPTAGLAPTPIWLIVLFGALFYWGQLYLDSHGGGFHPQVYEKFASFEHVRAANPVDPTRERVIKGEALFALCGACHGTSGQGGPLAPPLAGSEWVNEPNPARLIRIPLHGLTGKITVKGVEYNMSMTAFGGQLNDEDLAAILTYIRQAWGNSAPPVTTEQVAAVRKETTDRSQQWTDQEIKAISVSGP